VNTEPLPGSLVTVTSPPIMRASGYREILGICEGAKEDNNKTGWSAFLKHLKERGLKGVRLITSDACIGLAESAAEFFPEAAWQRCVVHWYRNIFSHVPSTKVREIAAMLKAIHASEDLAANVHIVGSYRPEVHHGPLNLPFLRHVHS
jgi:transposase-like protein